MIPQAPQAPGAPGGGAPPNISALLGALQGAKQDNSKEMEDPMHMNPASASSDGNTVYFPKELFKGTCKKGEKITISGEVVSVGSKIGIQPEEAKTADKEDDEDKEDGGADEEGEGEPAQERY